MSQTDTNNKPFNPNEHLMQIKTKNGLQDYLAVQWRLVWFREQCPEGIIETELIQLDLDRETTDEGFAWNEEKRRSEKVIKRAAGYALFKATVKDGKGGIATGYKSERAAAFADYAEKAETGAIGRALAALGYGTQFAPELDEEHRIVDSPVANNNGSAQAQPRQEAASAMATSASPKPAQVRQEPNLVQTNHAKVEALLDEYKRLQPKACTERGWERKLLREVWHIEQGTMLTPATAYTPEHVVALAQYVKAYRKEAEATQK